MKAIFRILGTAAAVAATGAAIVIMDKLLNEKAAPIIESIEFPEEAATPAASSSPPRPPRHTPRVRPRQRPKPPHRQKRPLPLRSPPPLRRRQRPLRPQSL